MKITKEELQGIVKEVMQEETDYQDYFRTMLKKAGVKSPAQIKGDAERKNFFNKVEAGWKGVNERIKSIRSEQAEKIAKLKEEEEAREHELDEINGKIDGAIEALESLRPVNEEALPKDGTTIKVSNIPVKIEYVSNKKYIGYSWKDKNNKEHYEETKTSDHSNLNSLIKTIKINLDESVNGRETEDTYKAPLAQSEVPFQERKRFRK